MQRPEPLLFFGKLPSRGDFVRSAQGPGLIQTLDRWLSSGLEALAVDPRWKEIYDRAQPMHLAFLGSRNPLGLAGHLVASRDASGRRFPFITAARLQTTQPLDFMARSPQALSRAWSLLATAARQACEAQDATPVLADLSKQTVDLHSQLGGYHQSLQDFLEFQTVSSLGGLLAQAGHVLDLRQTLLGLGLLLQPLPGSAVQSLDRGLLLPLPADPLYRPLVASLWLDLVAGFLARADFELGIFMPLGTQEGPPVMALGFEGASARVLQATLDPAKGREVFIDTREAVWVEDHLGHDYAVHKLASYLAQGGLSLRQAALTFKEVFLGS
jgi:type VI secretion system protein ImpM